MDAYGNWDKRSGKTHLWLSERSRSFLPRQSLWIGRDTHAAQQERGLFRNGSLLAFALEGCAASRIDQREYCEAHDLPVKRFGDWRAKLKDQMPTPARRLVWRRRGGVSPSVGTGMRQIPLVRFAMLRAASRPVAPRIFIEADKRRIVEET